MSYFIISSPDNLALTLYKAYSQVKKSVCVIILKILKLLICLCDISTSDVYRVTLLTDEIRLSGVDRVLQLVRGDTELVFWRPVNGDGVMGGGAQLVSDGWRVGSCM